MSSNRRYLHAEDPSVAKYEEMEINVPSFSYFYGTGSLFASREEMKKYECIVIEESLYCLLPIVDYAGALDARPSLTMSISSLELESS